MNNGAQNIYGHGQSFATRNSDVPTTGYPQVGTLEGLDPSMGPSQTLDQIINQNNQEMMRRRQTVYHTPFPHDNNTNSSPEKKRRSSMMEFNSNGDGDLADFQFDPNPRHAHVSGEVNHAGQVVQKPNHPRNVRSREQLSLDTRYAPLSTYNQASMSAYPASAIANSSMGEDALNHFIQQGMDMNGDFTTMNGNLESIHMTQPQPQSTTYTTSPVNTDFASHFQPTSNEQAAGVASTANNQNPMRTPQNNSSNALNQRFLGKSHNQIRRSPMMPSPLSLSLQNAFSNPLVSPAPPIASATPTTQHQPALQHNSSDMSSPFPTSGQDGMQMDPSALVQSTPEAKWTNAYSSTGFDMLAILMRVATRRNPQINIGPVDLACAFVVCDIAKHDLPIVYCSDMFERLTGYSRHEILGRNCRFLQAPDGRVQSGVKRRYVDDKSVLYLKNQVNSREEAQLSLINYRKGGQPFMNLLTMIPITWDSEEFRYFVGFQVDLVEQPNSVSAKNPNGTYEINYNRSALPAYRLPAPDTSSALENMGGQTISRDDVSQVLGTMGNGETDLSRRIWDKVLLENTDDVVHVLSLKGLFLYLSPACKTVLEYDPTELVGTALSAICHPSDIVPVTRELKDSSNGTSVNVVYRIRRKHTGYTWFEAHGSLHTEQGKGRKCIILVGRQRPVYALLKDDIISAEGAGESELWTKMSTSGMFLFVSSTSRSMLDRLPDDLVGTSMQALMRPEARKEFGRVLELARMGERSTFKHDMQNRRGQVLQAQTTVYPGDAKRGSKPTFLLAQTRLLKLTRAMLLSQKSNTSVPKSELSVGSFNPNITSNLTAPSNQAQQSEDDPINDPSSIYHGESGILTQAGSGGVAVGNQDEALANEDNIFDELKTTRSTSWQFELRQMERRNRMLAEDLQTLLSRKKKRKRRKGMNNLEKDCANCHTRVTPEWRRGPSGQRDLCNSCGLRWAKQNGRVSPRKSGHSEKSSASPLHAANDTSGDPTLASPSTPVHGSSKTPSQTPGKNEKRSSREINSMPSVIEEGQDGLESDTFPA